MKTIKEKKKITCFNYGLKVEEKIIQGISLQFKNILVSTCLCSVFFSAWVGSKKRLSTECYLTIMKINQSLSNSSHHH